MPVRVGGAMATDIWQQEVIVRGDSRRDRREKVVKQQSTIFVDEYDSVFFYLIMFSSS